MATKRKIAIALCIFLTIAPLIGSFFSNETIGECIGNLTPYIHLTVPQIDGMPFADAIGALLGIMIFLFGVVGFIILGITKLKNTTVLKALLAITIIYCGLRAIGGLFLSILLSGP